MTELTVDEIRRTRLLFRFDRRRGGLADRHRRSRRRHECQCRQCAAEDPGGAAEALAFSVLSHAPGRLLPTIRSRCRRLDLAPLRRKRSTERRSERRRPASAPTMPNLRFAAQPPREAFVAPSAFSRRTASQIYRGLCRLLGGAFPISMPRPLTRLPTSSRSGRRRSFRRLSRHRFAPGSDRRVRGEGGTGRSRSPVAGRCGRAA